MQVVWISINKSYWYERRTIWKVSWNTAYLPHINCKLHWLLILLPWRNMDKWNAPMIVKNVSFVMQMQCIYSLVRIAQCWTVAVKIFYLNSFTTMLCSMWHKIKWWSNNSVYRSTTELKTRTNLCNYSVLKVFKI